MPDFWGIAEVSASSELFFCGRVMIFYCVMVDFAEPQLSACKHTTVFQMMYALLFNILEYLSYNTGIFTICNWSTILFILSRL